MLGGGGPGSLGHRLVHDIVFSQRRGKCNTSFAEYTTFIFNELVMRKRGCKAHLNADLRNGRERGEQKK